MKGKTDSKKSNSKISAEYLLQDVEITPLKDFPSGIHHNQYNFDIKEGVSVTIPRMFLPNMVTEGVIKELPKEG